MGILDWLKHVTSEPQGGAKHPSVPPSTGTRKELEFDDGEQHFHGLDMKGALEAHRAWRVRLEAQIRGDATESLEVANVAADHNCALGKWLHGEGKNRFTNVTEYEELVRDHANFHLAAGEILMTSHQGKRESASRMLKSDFRHHSDRVQLSLVRLFAHARKTIN